MHLISSHPVVSALTALYLLSAIVDGLKLCPPQPGDSRLYVFTYTVINSLAGNLITALKTFLTKK